MRSLRRRRSSSSRPRSPTSGCCTCAGTVPSTAPGSSWRRRTSPRSATMRPVTSGRRPRCWPRVWASCGPCGPRLSRRSGGGSGASFGCTTRRPIRGPSRSSGCCPRRMIRSAGSTASSWGKRRSSSSAPARAITSSSRPWPGAGVSVRWPGSGPAGGRASCCSASMMPMALRRRRPARPISGRSWPTSSLTLHCSVNSALLGFPPG